MKSILVALALMALGAAITLTWQNNTEQPQQELTPPADHSLEVSIAGNVRVYKASADSTFHVILNDDLELTDIQVIPHSGQLQSKPVNIEHGKSTNTVFSKAGT